MLSLVNWKSMSFPSVYYICFMISFLCITYGKSDAKKWVIERQDNGITVSKRSEKGRDLPSFKGTGIVQGNLYEILAILRDGAA